MTEEELIEMAIKSDFEIYPDNLITWDGIECTNELIAFAKLVAEAEREACAKEVENALYGQEGCGKASEAIRERGQE